MLQPVLSDTSVPAVPRLSRRLPTLQVLTNPSSHAVYSIRFALPPTTPSAAVAAAAVLVATPPPPPLLRCWEGSGLDSPPPPSTGPSLLLMAVKPGLFGCRAATPKMNAPEDASQKCSSPDAVPEHRTPWLKTSAEIPCKEFGQKISRQGNAVWNILLRQFFLFTFDESERNRNAHSF